MGCFLVMKMIVCISSIVLCWRRVFWSLNSRIFCFLCICRVGLIFMGLFLNFVMGCFWKIKWLDLIWKWACFVLVVGGIWWGVLRCLCRIMKYKCRVILSLGSLDCFILKLECLVLVWLMGSKLLFKIYGRW